MISIRTDLYKITFFFWVLVVSGEVYGQLVIGADALALGMANTAADNNNWGVFSNPASLQANHHVVGFYSQRNYGISELTDVAVSGSSPTNFGIMGVGIHSFGGDLYKETRIRLAYARIMGSVKFGAVVNYNMISFGGGYGNASALGIDLGILVMVAKDVTLGARTTNINQPAYDGEDEYLPRELALGIACQLEEALDLYVDVVKDVRFPVSIRGGVEIHVIEGLKGRVGVMSEPDTYSVGIGYQVDAWEVNLGFQKHGYLGISPGLDLNVFF